MSEIDIDKYAKQYAELLWRHGMGSIATNYDVYKQMIPIGLEMMRAVAQEAVRKAFAAHHAMCHPWAAMPAPDGVAAPVADEDWQKQLYDALQRGVYDSQDQQGSLTDCQFKRIRSLFDAHNRRLIAERDAARVEVERLKVLGATAHGAEQLAVNKKLRERVEAAEGALAELRRAVTWHARREIKITGTMQAAPPHDAVNSILAEYRKTQEKTSE